ncbi:MAG: hypothetical protein O3A93_13930 [Chloroflexi bacterium]|nr:hypothetical protein [Chloroflexota bacterium]MDA1272328.1 hypothetical protein [Chloroflexota bacterium]PKB58648.1 MAG: hypothetical protein BZY83_06245 [SAR202 cluster bacterium Casp-Chloro-G2]
MTTQPVRRRIDEEIQDVIEGLAAINWTPAQIHRELSKRQELKPPLPTLRTVQRIVKEATPKDPSGPWNLAKSDTEHSRIILDLIAYLINRTEGRIHSITEKEAEWYVKVHFAAPDLEISSAWLLTRTYMRRSEGYSSTEAMDAYLALKPWASKELQDGYSNFVKQNPNLRYSSDPWSLGKDSSGSMTAIVHSPDVS